MDKFERVPRTGEEQPGERIYPDDMRITMAIPHRDIVHGIPGVSTYTLKKFFEMAETTAKAGYEVFVNTETKTSNTPVTRTKIVNAFKGDWLLMMDSDAFPEGDTVNKLLLAAKEDPDNLRKIVCVPAVRPSFPNFCAFGNVKESGQFVPWRYTIEFGDEELNATETCVREVDGSGFHCVLIHRSVFDVVPYPWFPLNVLDPETGIAYGHDYTFCRAAKRLGDIQTYIDFSCRVGHYGIQPFTLQHNAMIIKSIPAEADRQKHFDIDVDALDTIDEPEYDADHMMNFPVPGRDKITIPEDMALPSAAIVDKEDKCE